VDLYLTPSIVYMPVKPKQRIVPAFFFRLERSDNKAFIEYWWIEQETGNGKFKVYRYSVEEGQPQTADGDVERFAQLFPRDKVNRVAILPEDMELDVFLSSFSKIASEKIAIEEKQFNPIRAAFCQIMVDQFASMQAAIAMQDTSRLNGFFKGLSIGSSKNIFGFLMQATKKCYDAFGFYCKTYSGLRFASFGFEDLLTYIHSHRTGFPKTLSDFGMTLFIKKPKAAFPAPVSPPPIIPTALNPPDPPRFTIPNVDKNFKGIPAQYLEIIRKSMKYWKGYNVMMPMPAPKAPLDPALVLNEKNKPVIVHEYGFRGDKRPPLVVYHCGGLHPNAIRYFDTAKGRREFEEKRKALFQKAYTDYQMGDLPHFDPWLHQSNEYNEISVFLSVSRNPLNARVFAGSDGYIYVIRGSGAIDQDLTFQIRMYKEYEFSIPGGVDWDDIIAFRAIVKNVFQPFCYVRENNKWRFKEREVQDKAIAAMMQL